MISLLISKGVRPLARIAPAYGTEILPCSSTAWFGIVTKLPARTPASDVKSPPAAASKIVTLTISPIPKRNAFGGV